MLEPYADEMKAVLFNRAKARHLTLLDEMQMDGSLNT
jgi:hypothetical protein